jgi:hypothetical protein
MVCPSSQPVTGPVIPLIFTGKISLFLSSVIFSIPLFLSLKNMLALAAL